MSRPSMPIPDEQVRRFNHAVCERFGLDPSIIGESGFKADFQVMGGEELGKVSVSFDAYLPADEILAMFNGTAR